MALTKIKTGGLTDNSVTDAKVADAITVTGTQTGITQVGTLTGLTVAHNNITLQGTGETQLLVNSASGNNAGIRFQENGSNKWTIGNDQSDDSLFFYDFGGSAKRFSIDSAGDVSLLTAGKRYYIPRASDGALTGSLYSSTGNTITLSGAGSSSGQINFIPSASNSSAVALTLDSSQNATFAGAVTLQDQLTVKAEGASNDIVAQWQATNGNNCATFRTTDSGHVFKIMSQNSGTLEFDTSSATFSGELRVNGGQASIYGAEGADSILELNSDEADDNADRWQMYVFNTNNYLKWRHYSTGSWVDRLWLSSATDNWAMNLTGNSPYGMQITTTSDGSSAHDAFVIRRAGSAKVLEVFNDGVIGTYGDASSLNFYNTAGTLRAFLQLSSTGLIIDTDSFIQFKPNNTVSLDLYSDKSAQFHGNPYPSGNNTINLGASGARWSVIYTSNSVNVSDKTTKKNITDCDLGVDFINSLKPKSYKMKGLKEGHDDYNRKHFGLIAQDLIDTELNDSVFGDKDGEYSLAYNDLIAPMIKSIQELSAKVTALENA